MKLLLFFWMLAVSFLSWADDMRPASLTVTTIDSFSYEVNWSVPLKNGRRPDLSVTFASDSKVSSPRRLRQINNTIRESWVIERDTGLSGSTISITGLKGSSYEVLLRIIDEKQQTITAVLNTEKPDYVVPDFATIEAEDTVIAYIILGVKHILIGLDHLLFLACLVYISGTRKKLLLTITGFTLAHSVTLILAATGVLAVAIPPVEAVIALSVVFLAWEIAKNKKSSLSLTYPVLVSSSFGLLHGFGFASVLADIGLPETEKLLALLCFNVGVEIGQLLFVTALFLAYFVLSRLYKPLSVERLRLPVSYLCGSLASLWVLQRLAIF